MNAPAQGTLPWFYNEILPKGEWAIRSAVHKIEGKQQPSEPWPKKIA